MNAVKNLEEYEVIVDSRESIRLPQEIREQLKISKGTIFIVKPDSNGNLYLIKKDDDLIKKELLEKKKKFMKHFKNIDLSKKEEVTSDEFIKEERRF
ncbi:AbrB/MazE/SpoVT family DNA-binding domain-containing protein [Silvanigrella sp.]|uniref:AbrB/MazE/SpoVT family DNA-binding domain-containing protein n=1 Tax=Silvanigrella sp. TaxID=2024976 RepID=UPI0037C6B91B